MLWRGGDALQLRVLNTMKLKAQALERVLGRPGGAKSENYFLNSLLILDKLRHQGDRERRHLALRSGSPCPGACRARVALQAFAL
jgi:hypothetical protein